MIKKYTGDWDNLVTFSLSDRAYDRLKFFSILYGVPIPVILRAALDRLDVARFCEDYLKYKRGL